MYQISTCCPNRGEPHRHSLSGRISPFHLTIPLSSPPFPTSLVSHRQDYDHPYSSSTLFFSSHSIVNTLSLPFFVVVKNLASEPAAISLTTTRCPPLSSTAPRCLALFRPFPFLSFFFFFFFFFFFDLLNVFFVFVLMESCKAKNTGK